MTQPEDPSSDRRHDVIVTRGESSREPEADFVAEPLAEPVSVRERIAIVRRNILLALGVAAIAGGLAAYAVRRAAPIYRATSTVRVSDLQSNLTANVGTQNASQRAWAIDPVKSQMELLASRATAEEAVDKGLLQLRELAPRKSLTFLAEIDARRVSAVDTLTLRFADSTVTAQLDTRTATAPYATPILVGQLRLVVPARPPLQSATYQVIPRETVIAGLQEGLKPLRREGTDISDLVFENPDPYYTQRALNAATLSFQALNMRSSQQAARARREFLENQLRKTEATLEVQRAQLSAFRSASQAFSSKDKIAAEQQSLTDIQIRLGELQADKQVYMRLLARAQAARDVRAGNGMKALISAPGIQSNPLILQLYDQLAQQRATRDSLTTGPFASAATNPDVQRLDALMRSTTDQIITAASDQVEVLDARIAALYNLSTQSAAQVSALPKTEAEEARLLQEAEGTQKMAEELREEQQRARISEVAQAGQVEVIDLAQLPTQPIDGGGSRKILFATLLGLFIGAGLTLLIDSLNSSLRRTSDVERVLRLPTLGSIPELEKAGVTRRRLPSLLPVFKGHRTNGSDKSRLVDPSTPAFESFRSLRTSLIFSHAVKSLRSIVVTSAAPGDGKTTVVSNLAAAFAQQGMKVLAVDCDLRRGRLHSAFNLPRTPGLTDLVTGQATLEEVIRETSIPNLSLMAAGTRPPNPSELLGSDPVRHLLAQIGNQFDLMILDTPPVLAAADAPILGSIVDGVIVLVRMGITDKNAAKRALERLNVVGARVLGTVLNDPEEILSSSEDYYYYHYKDKTPKRRARAKT